MHSNERYQANRGHGILWIQQACQSKTSQYAQVTRHWKKLKQQTHRLLQIETAAAADAGPQLVTPTNDADTLVGENSTTRRSFEWTSEDIDDLLEANYFLPPIYPVDRTEDQASLTGKVTLEKPFPALTSLEPLASLTTNQNQRRTTQAAHFHRQVTAEMRSIRSSLFKAATILHKSVVWTGATPLWHFTTQINCQHV